MEKRNPYLMEYEEQVQLRGYCGQKRSRREIGRNSENQNLRALEPIVMRQAVGSAAPRQESSRQTVRSTTPRQAMRVAATGRTVRSAESRQAPPERRQPAAFKSGSKAALGDSRAAAKARRKKIVRRQRMVVGIWTACILLLAVALLTGNDRVSAADQTQKPQNNAVINDLSQQSDEVMIQGFSAAVFSGHPYWKENFLTPNEYSRPGDPLGEVTNLFVHYTANPGTSAAQNRSYFEQQKDTHEHSVSAHFIIGYEGEIIQCVPLDEIAYAVQTRNQDSISIECCYLEKDGSFTQETYDSLIDLLAWLTQIYELDTDDILRHYDCGGKKCPIYYTEHEDAWEQMKSDVAKKIAQSQLGL